MRPSLAHSGRDRYRSNVTVSARSLPSVTKPGLLRPRLGCRAWMLLCLSTSILVGCARRPADNLLLVSFDTTRVDRLSAYGYGQATSPALEALAARGVLFQRAFTHVPSTLPAIASMLTGLLPPTHGVRCNGKFRLSDSWLTLAEILSREGFDTAAIIGAFPLEKRFGTAQGFDLYDDDFSSSALTARRQQRHMDSPGFWIGHDYLDFERAADEVTERSVAWLEQRRRRGSSRWFLFAHYFDPHWPYEPAEAWAERFESPYDAEIAYADHYLGRLLEAVARMPGRTLIVFTADHGEGLGEHGEQLHNRYLYNSTLHVPLIIALDGYAREGHQAATTTGHIDLMPTVLELLRVAPPPGLPGRSLVPELRGEESPVQRPLYAESLVWTLERPRQIEVRALIDGGFKLIDTRVGGPQGPRYLELYDLGVDLRETIDLARFDASLTRDLGQRLGELKTKLEDSDLPHQAIELDDGARARLKSLGYL